MVLKKFQSQPVFTQKCGRHIKTELPARSESDFRILGIKCKKLSICYVCDLVTWIVSYRIFKVFSVSGKYFCEAARGIR